MHRSAYVPGHDVRHRIAVLWLYRTLLRQAKGLKLPVELLGSNEPHPIARSIRRRFTADRAYGSSRLIYASLSLGYQFIGILDKARDPSSPEYHHILKQVQARKPPSSGAPRSARQLSSRSTKIERLGLLEKVSASDGTFSYRPRGVDLLHDQSTQRHLPYVTSTSDGRTFLRQRKPQPYFLSKKLTKLWRIDVARTTALKEMEDQWMSGAYDEDNWDRLIASQERLEGLVTESDDATHIETQESSYKWSVALSRLWMKWRKERDHMELVERGKGHQAIVDSLRALRTPDSDDHIPRTEDHQGNAEQALENVSAVPSDTFYPLTAIIKRSGACGISPDVVDPFASPGWQVLVRERGRQTLNRMKKDCATSNDTS